MARLNGAVSHPGISPWYTPWWAHYFGGMFPWHDVCRSPASRLVELPAPVPPRPSVGTGARDGGLGALRMPGRDGGAGTRPPVGPVPGGRVPVDLAAASAPGRRRL